MPIIEPTKRDADAASPRELGENQTTEALNRTAGLSAGSASVFNFSRTDGQNSGLAGTMAMPAGVYHVVWSISAAAADTLHLVLLQIQEFDVGSVDSKTNAQNNIIGMASAEDGVNQSGQAYYTVTREGTMRVEKQDSGGSTAETSGVIFMSARRIGSA